MIQNFKEKGSGEGGGGCYPLGLSLNPPKGSDEIIVNDITVFIRLTALIKFLALESGRLFEVGAYSRLGAY